MYSIKQNEINKHHLESKRKRERREREKEREREKKKNKEEIHTQGCSFIVAINTCYYISSRQGRDLYIKAGLGITSVALHENKPSKCHLNIHKCQSVFIPSFVAL